MMGSSVGGGIRANREPHSVLLRSPGRARYSARARPAVARRVPVAPARVPSDRRHRARAVGGVAVADRGRPSGRHSIIGCAAMERRGSGAGSPATTSRMSERPRRWSAGSIPRTAKSSSAAAGSTPTSTAGRRRSAAAPSPSPPLRAGRALVGRARRPRRRDPAARERRLRRPRLRRDRQLAAGESRAKGKVVVPRRAVGTG